MARVQSPSGRPLTPPLTLSIDETLTIKLIPEPGERLPFAVSATGVTIVDIAPPANRIAANFATVAIRGRAAGDTALDIASADGRRTAPVAVRVIGRLSLPDAGTDAGLLARLLLAETPPPRSADDLPEIAEAMQLMRVVLQNRLRTPSSRWGSAGARSLGDVARARNQFEGFSAYPKLPQTITDRIAEVLRVANAAGDPRSRWMRPHVEQALAIAAAAPPRDPTATGLYWWKTLGAPPPGNNVQIYRTIKRNTFWREGP